MHTESLHGTGLFFLLRKDFKWKCIISTDTDHFRGSSLQYLVPSDSPQIPKQIRLSHNVFLSIVSIYPLLSSIPIYLTELPKPNAFGDYAEYLGM